MGIDANAARFLLAARERGVRFETAITLGRQDLNVSAQELEELFRSFGRGGELRSDLNDGSALLSLLGARQVDAIDVSDYEGASHLHDLNDPIPEGLKEKYTLVFDGGTLEHVFNFPRALQNCMEMVCAGGHLILFTPANNFLGHGFYQFSPELFFRALSPANGFEVERVVAAEVDRGWYEVIDPVDVRQRVELSNDRPVYLLVQAKRTGVVPVFGRWPQQSDYATIWTEYGGEKPASQSELEFAVRQRLRRYPWLWRVLRRLKGIRNALHQEASKSFSNRKFFRPVDR